MAGMEYFRRPQVLLPLVISLLFFGLWVQSNRSGKVSTWTSSATGDDDKRGPDQCDYLFKSTGWCGTVRWNHPLNQGIENEFQAEVKLSPLKNVPPSSVQVPSSVILSLWMPGMGHGSSPTRVTPGPRPMTWLVKNVYFSMRGEWEIWLTLMKGDTFLEKAPLRVDIR